MGVEKIQAIEAQIIENNSAAEREISEIKARLAEKNSALLEKRGAFVEKIPNFWVETLQNCPLISPILTDEDLEVLDYISALEVESVGGRDTIKFKFEENPFFNNKELTKSYEKDEFGIYTESKSTKIEWKLEKMQEKHDLELSEDSHFFDWFGCNLKPNMDVVGKTIVYEIYPFPTKYYMDAPEEEEDEERGNLDIPEDESM